MTPRNWNKELDPDLIYRYVELKQSRRQIARKLGYGESTIGRHLTRLGLKTSVVRVIEPKQCPICHEWFIKRKNEDQKKYDVRRTCGNPECRKTINSLSNPEKAALYKRLAEGKRDKYGTWPHWMYVEKPFAKYNICVKPDLTPMMARPDPEISSYTGSAMALVVENA